MTEIEVIIGKAPRICFLGKLVSNFITLSSVTKGNASMSKRQVSII